MTDPVTQTRTRFLAYVTKYALTAGIKTVWVEDCFDISRTMVKEIRDKQSVGIDSCYHNGEWHRTREAAVARAEAMRGAKIQSMRKKLAKLEGMTF